MLTNNDFFLDAMCLSLYSDDIECQKMLKQVVQIYDDSKKVMSQDVVARLYVNVIREVLENHFDLNNQADISSLLLKFSHSTAINRDPELLINLRKVIENRGKIKRQRLDNR